MSHQCNLETCTTAFNEESEVRAISSEKTVLSFYGNNNTYCWYGTILPRSLTSPISLIWRAALKGKLAPCIVIPCTLMWKLRSLNNNNFFQDPSEIVTEQWSAFSTICLCSRLSNSAVVLQLLNRHLRWTLRPYGKSQGGFTNKDKTSELTPLLKSDDSLLSRPICLPSPWSFPTSQSKHLSSPSDLQDFFSLPPAGT